MPLRELWTDQRIEERFKGLDDRIREMSVVVERVGPLVERVNGVSDDIKEIKDSIKGLRSDLSSFAQSIMGNPIREARERRGALMVGLLSAVGGGGITAVAAAFLGGFGH